MLRRAEEDGLKPGGTIVEATSGNTGASLALLAALRGYKCVFVMPDKMSQEKISHLRAFGARVVVCPTAVEPEDPRSYYQVAQRIAARDAQLASTRTSTTTPPTPRRTTSRAAPRSGQQTGGEFDVFCAGMGTGGTLSGTGKFLQREEAGHQDRRRRSRGLALLRLRQERAHHQALLVQGRGHRRGLLPDDDEPQDPRRHRARRRQGVLPHDARAHAPRGALRRRLGRRGGRGRRQVRARHGRAWPRAGGRPAGAHPGLPRRRRAQVRVEDLQRRLDARERLPRGRAGHRHRARPPRRPRARGRS